MLKNLPWNCSLWDSIHLNQWWSTYMYINRSRELLLPALSSFTKRMLVQAPLHTASPFCGQKWTLMWLIIFITGCWISNLLCLSRSCEKNFLLYFRNAYIYIYIFSDICEELILSFFQVHSPNFPNYFSHAQFICKSHPILNSCICSCQILVSVLPLLSTVTFWLEI